ncbi:ATP-dependent Clp protease proteolytic subunit [bacterium]|nr:ATP-dependent Clp protease proteolytic subunit [bacterium]
MGRTAETKSKSAVSKNSSSDFDPVTMVTHGSESRIVVLYGGVSEQSIAATIVQLLYLANQNHKPIHLVVSTYGGSVDEMFSLYDTIKFLPCPVHTIALGKVMSAGVLLLASGVKGKRMIGSSARLMMHPISGGFYGNVFESVNETNEHKRLHHLMTTALQKETNMSIEKIESIMKSGHDYYISAEDAIKLGIVDKVIGQ